MNMSQIPNDEPFVANAVALTIAGSDPSGGAGLQADLKTFQQLGVYGMSVITLVTVQNTQAVRQVEVLSPELIVAQLDAVLEDIPPQAIKTGALGSAEVVQAVGERLAGVSCPIVVDPVLVSKHGHALVTDDVVEAYKQFLLPRATLITPNRFEAERLFGCKLDDEGSVSAAMVQLRKFENQNVLIKFGRVEDQFLHLLVLSGERVDLTTPYLEADNTHGSGCILAASITAQLALGESRIQAAVEFGIRQTSDAVRSNSHLGHGVHPVEIRAMTGQGLFRK